MNTWEHHSSSIRIAEAAGVSEWTARRYLADLAESLPESGIEHHEGDWWRLSPEIEAAVIDALKTAKCKGKYARCKAPLELQFLLLTP